MTQQVFANYIGTTPATLSGIFNDRTRPTINIIESIKKKFPDISLEWLMFGEGEMYQSARQEENEENTHPAPHHPGENSQMSIFDFEASTSPAPASTSNIPQAPHQRNSVKNTQQEAVREEIKIIDKPSRHVTEIRVYYDDQTWESFVPAKI